MDTVGKECQRKFLLTGRNVYQKRPARMTRDPNDTCMQVENKSDVYRTKTFLEPSGCQTRHPQPARTWLLGPEACSGFIQISRFVRDMVQIKQKSEHGVKNTPPRSFWCGTTSNEYSETLCTSPPELVATR